MICHQCNQNNIKIELGHITCNICGLDIDISINLEEDKLLDLFIYNDSLGIAERLGREAYIDDKGSSDNPYSLDPIEIMLNKAWGEGFDRERIAYEKEAFSSSVVKLNSEIEKLVKKEEDQRVAFIELFGKYEKWRLFVVALSKKEYILGKKYRQHMYDFFNDIDDLDNPGK